MGDESPVMGCWRGETLRTFCTGRGVPGRTGRRTGRAVTGPAWDSGWACPAAWPAQGLGS